MLGTPTVADPLVGQVAGQSDGRNLLEVVNRADFGELPPPRLDSHVTITGELPSDIGDDVRNRVGTRPQSEGRVAHTRREEGRTEDTPEVARVSVAVAV